jgi:tripartite-type tricarboxylate transporter receptor subunit TctC
MRWITLRKRPLNGLALISALSLALVSLPDETQAASAFNPKRIKILIGFPPAGGHDLEARVIARHLPKYFRGKPSIIVQNMPGAGGKIMGAYIYNRSKPDGTTAAIFGSSQLQENILGAGVEYDVRDMPIVWAVRSVRVGIVRDFLKAKTAKDLTDIDPSKIAVAGRSKTDSSCVTGSMALTLLGIKNFKKVCAYAGTAVIRGAVERGEASFFEASDPHFLGQGAFVELYKKGMVVQMWQSGQVTEDGKIVRAKTVNENTPTFQEAYRAVHGKDPSGPLWEAFRKVYNDVHSTLTRTLVLPPGTPGNIVNALREGIDSMSNDPAFVKDWEKVFGQEFAGARVPALEAEKVKVELMKPAPWQDTFKKFVGM